MIKVGDATIHVKVVPTITYSGPPLGEEKARQRSRMEKWFQEECAKFAAQIEAAMERKVEARRVARQERGNA